MFDVCATLETTGTHKIVFCQPNASCGRVVLNLIAADRYRFVAPSNFDIKTFECSKRRPFRTFRTHLPPKRRLVNEIRRSKCRRMHSDTFERVRTVRSANGMCRIPIANRNNTTHDTSTRHKLTQCSPRNVCVIACLSNGSVSGQCDLVSLFPSCACV